MSSGQFEELEEYFCGFSAYFDHRLNCEGSCDKDGRIRVAKSTIVGGMKIRMILWKEDLRTSFIQTEER